ncbi:uncharacterized protein [Palaemon carinicauda]|uniref:uncharacterized protein n=1 Tax=Palaemon carinicauda TaxID=392227 RepID=UPI0035B661B1
MIGKTFWKSIALPSILYGTNVINLTETEIEKLQRIENGVYRKILGATKSTANTALRGEIGASSMKARVMDGKLQYLNRTLNGKKEILKIIIQDIQEKEGRWWKQPAKYLEELSLGIRQIRRMNKAEIKTETRKWDTEKWKEEIESKVSLEIYRTWKKEIKEELIYDNTFASVISFRARTNTLKLNIVNRHNGGNVNCNFCENEEEDLIHFLLFCQEYRKERNEVIELQQPYEEDPKKIVGLFLFSETNIEKKKEVLNIMWKKRQNSTRR